MSARKLTEADAALIRGSQGIATQRELASRFGVTQPVIGRVQRGEWGKPRSPHAIIEGACITCGPDAQRDTDGRCSEGRRISERERMTPARRRDYALRFKFGITLADYEDLLKLQGGVCAICGTPPIRRGLDVDHDRLCCPGMRSCGKCIRGLLCSPCNRALGYFAEDPERLRVGIAYLERGRGK